MKNSHVMGRLLAITLAITALFNTSCVSVRAYRVVSIDDVVKMPAFDATVESIDISHPYVFWTAVDINLRKADGGYRMCIQTFPANKEVINFARSLHEGQKYAFPTVILDHRPTEMEKQKPNLAS
jgi:hypothetical protein